MRAESVFAVLRYLITRGAANATSKLRMASTTSSSTKVKPRGTRPRRCLVAATARCWKSDATMPIRAPPDRASNRKIVGAEYCRQHRTYYSGDENPKENRDHGHQQRDDPLKPALHFLVIDVGNAKQHGFQLPALLADLDQLHGQAREHAGFHQRCGQTLASLEPAADALDRLGHAPVADGLRRDRQG